MAAPATDDLFGHLEKRENVSGEEQGTAKYDKDEHNEEHKIYQKVNEDIVMDNVENEAGKDV